MTRPDDYDLGEAAQLGRRHNVETLLTAISAAVYATGHNPANGARVIQGWADGDTIRYTDDPVLWFDHYGHPAVVAPEAGSGVDVLLSLEPWCVYHPDTLTPGADHDPRQAAMDAVRQSLEDKPKP